MIIKSSRELYDFYVDWLAWAEGRASKNKYWECYGLCSNIPIDVLDAGVVSEELEDQFYMAGLDGSYPFGEFEYSYRGDDDTQHLDPNRLAWVRARIADGVKDE